MKGGNSKRRALAGAKGEGEPGKRRGAPRQTIGRTTSSYEKVWQSKTRPWSGVPKTELGKTAFTKKHGCEGKRDF